MGAGDEGEGHLEDNALVPAVAATAARACRGECALCIRGPARGYTRQNRAAAHGWSDGASGVAATHGNKCRRADAACSRCRYGTASKRTRRDRESEDG